MSHQYIKRNFPHEPFPVNCQVFGIALLDIRQCAFSAFTRQGEMATLKKPSSGAGEKTTYCGRPECASHGAHPGDS